MRRLLILPLLLLLLTACGDETDYEPTSAPIEPSAAPQVQTQPQTKTVYVRAESTTQTGSTVTRTEYVFDAAQQVCQVITYTNGEQTQTHDVTCDSHGNYVLWSSGDSQIRYSYDAQGRLLSYCAYVGELLISSTEYTWENGLRTEILRSVQGTQQRTALTYDEGGHLLRQDNYSNVELTDYWVYTLGEDGRPTAMSVYLADGTLSKTVTYAYEGDTVTATGSDGTSSRQIYDEYGNLLSDTEYDAAGDVVARQTHSWIAIEVPPDSLRASM